MTVHDIIKTAFANEYEGIESDPDAVRHSLDVLNLLLVECYSAEQNSRERDGKPLLTEIPSVSTLEDDVPYNSMLTRWALPYGLEAKYAEQNLEESKAIQYRQMYEDARMIAGGGVWV